MTQTVVQEPGTRFQGFYEKTPVTAKFSCQVNCYVDMLYKGMVTWNLTEGYKLKEGYKVVETFEPFDIEPNLSAKEKKSRRV